MNTIQENWGFWKKLLDMLENQFGNRCEIVLHDLTKDYEHTIVDIRNGHITDRRIGDCGNNLGLEVIRGNLKNGDRYNYVVHTPDGKILRSSTMFLHDNEGNLIGSLCINLDITQTVAMEGFLHSYNGYIPNESSQAVQETFAGNINDVLDFMIQQADDLFKKPVEKMNRDEKIRFVQFLDQKGAFLVTKASDRISKHLKISRFTLYNYLDIAKQNPESHQKGGKEENL